ncbi:MAG: DUF4105 domain-containing protein [Gemmatimonadota bacterium]
MSWRELSSAPTVRGRLTPALQVGGALLLVALLGAWLGRRPSNDRDWSPNDAVLPRAQVEGSRVHLRHVRHTTYATTEVYTPSWYDKAFDRDRLVRAWFVVEPFSRWTGAAHTFVSFEFEGPEYVAISVEARKQKGERYHFLKGLFRQYELWYLVADERDVIRLRTNVREDDVYLYPIRAPREKVRALFLAMLERANALRERPEFYNTLTSNCTSNIIRHVNTLSPHRIPFGFKALLPAFADELAYDVGLLDTELPFEEARAHFRINERARRSGDDPNFSTVIRQFDAEAAQEAAQEATQAPAQASVQEATREATTPDTPRGPIRETRYCVVARIVDGDTFQCRDGVRVRPIGMDAPELSQRPFGQEARAALERMIPVGTRVRLERDVELQDRYGRLLAYVWKDTRMVNWAMVRDGYAVLLTIPPNVQYVDDFREAQRAAREAGAGLWAEQGFLCLPADRRRRRC